MTRLSCQRFRSDEVRLWLSVIAYNLGNLRRLALPRRIGNWSLTSLQQRLVKTGGRLVKHARYYWLLRADDRVGFPREESQEAAKCRKHGSKEGRLRLWGPRESSEWRLP
jgi:hypothetical protein